MLPAACSSRTVPGIDPHLVEDDRQFVDQRKDIQLALVTSITFTASATPDTLGEESARSMILQI